MCIRRGLVGCQNAVADMVSGPGSHVEKTGLTVAALCDRTGISRRNITLIERATRTQVWWRSTNPDALADAADSFAYVVDETIVR